MRSSELIPILLLLTIPAQLLGVCLFHLLTRPKSARAHFTPQAKVVPFKTRRARR
jgi:hypothetical protein